MTMREQIPEPPKIKKQPEEEQRTPTRHTDDEQGMAPMAARITRHYLEPTPGAADLLPHTFPATVMRGLGLGAALGAVVGLVLGWLFWNGTIVIPGWEQMYSIGRFTLLVLWTMIGTALGVMTIGVWAIIAAKPELAPEPVQAHVERPTRS